MCVCVCVCVCVCEVLLKCVCGWVGVYLGMVCIHVGVCGSLCVSDWHFLTDRENASFNAGSLADCNPQSHSSASVYHGHG